MLMTFVWDYYKNIFCSRANHFEYHITFFKMFDIKLLTGYADVSKQTCCSSEFVELYTAVSHYS